MLGPLKRMSFLAISFCEDIDSLAHLSGETALNPRSACRHKMLNQHSTWFSQEAWVGV
jgi:hypothetical protein